MKKSLKLVIVAPLLLCMQFGQAQSSAADNTEILAYSIDPLVQRYPADSIQSTTMANDAVKEVAEARARLEARHAAEEQLCYPKFFTTSCLNKAAERKRLDLLSVRAIEIEANAYIRHARVETRDRKLEEKAREREAKNAADPILVTPKTDNSTPTPAPAETSGTSDAQRKARADAYVKKNTEHAKRQQELQQKEESGAAERAANVEKYEEKQKEALKRQKEIAERKAEKERLKASKDAKEKSAAPPPDAVN